MEKKEITLWLVSVFLLFLPDRALSGNALQPQVCLFSVGLLHYAKFPSFEVLIFHLQYDNFALLESGKNDIFSLHVKASYGRHKSIFGFPKQNIVFISH